MLTDDFKAFVRKVQDTLGASGLYADTYQLLNIADALYVEPVPQTTHERLVALALNDQGTYAGRWTANADHTVTVIGWMAQNKKINAIKRLRALAQSSNLPSGLRECKEAVEDTRVSQVLSVNDCPHGLSRDLCENPNGSLDDAHYPPDRDDPPF